MSAFSMAMMRAKASYVTRITRAATATTTFSHPGQGHHQIDIVVEIDSEELGLGDMDVLTYSSGSSPTR